MMGFLCCWDDRRFRIQALVRSQFVLLSSEGVLQLNVLVTRLVQVPPGIVATRALYEVVVQPAKCMKIRATPRASGGIGCVHEEQRIVVLVVLRPPVMTAP